MKAKELIIVCLSLLMHLSLFGQIQITIIPAPDYTLANRDQWQVIVNNITNQSLTVFFHGLVTESQRGVIYETQSQQRDLQPGITNFSTQYYVGLEPFTTIQEEEGLNQYAIQTNGLPAGDYEICITALSALGDELGRNCIQFSVDHFTPPILVAPEDKDTVSEPNPFFSWLPPVPNTGQQFTYRLSLFENQNMQTAMSAVQTNAAFYEAKGITMPIWQYGINARNLRSGYRYSWKVAAQINGQTVAESEVWSFVFAKPKIILAPTGKDPAKATVNPPKPGIPYLELQQELTNNFSVLDRGLISFVYTHSSTTASVGLRILNMNGESVFGKRLEVGTGLNYFSHPLKEFGALQTGVLYELQIVDVSGQIKMVRFKVKP